jgi:acetolactate synthase-1/3 small subunit
MGEEKERGSQRPYVVSITVENRPGVLARVASLFSARNYNIEALTAAHSKEPGTSMITCTTWGDARTMERIVKQLRNLVEVKRVVHAPLDVHNPRVREMILVKLDVEGQRQREALERAKKFGARILRRAPRGLLIEATGSGERLEELLAALGDFRVEHIARSGPVILSMDSRPRRRGPPGLRKMGDGYIGASGPVKQKERSGLENGQDRFWRSNGGGSDPS